GDDTVNCAASGRFRRAGYLGGARPPGIDDGQDESGLAGQGPGHLPGGQEVLQHQARRQPGRGAAETAQRGRGKGTEAGSAVTGKPRRGESVSGNLPDRLLLKSKGLHTACRWLGDCADEKEIS